jgi:hypothetical protein
VRAYSGKKGEYKQEGKQDISQWKGGHILGGKEGET